MYVSNPVSLNIIVAMNTPPEKVNFAKLINDLQRKAGWTLVAIAHNVGCSQPHLSRFKNGELKEPMFGLGMRIVELHRKEMLKVKQRLEQRCAPSG